MTAKLCGNALNLTSIFVRSPKFSYLFVFLMGIILRGIPELLVSRYPVGYETITYYAPPMFAFREEGLGDVFFKFFTAGPLLYIFMWVAHFMSGAHPYLILKVTGPVLYGGLAVSFLFFLKRGLRLDWKMAFVAALLFVFQLAALRESWDRFRNVLALIFLFATLTALKTKIRFRWLFVGGFAVLTALAREYIAFVLFVAVLGFAILKREDRAMSLVGLAPALVIFVFMFAPTLIWLYNLFPDNPFAIGSYSWMVRDCLSIFAICYLPLVLFLVKGWRRDRLLDPILAWLLLGSFSVVVSPWIAVPGYQRWLVLLVFPFTVYAVRGFERLRMFNRGSRRKLVTIILIFSVIGLGYSSGAFSYVVLPNSWIPSNLVQSSIAWDQTDDVKEILMWLNENGTNNSCLLCEERFYGWTLIYLKRASEDIEVILYGANSPPEPALEKAISDGHHWIYLIWYSSSQLEDFKQLYCRNSISILQYEKQVALF